MKSESIPGLRPAAKRSVDDVELTEELGRTVIRPAPTGSPAAAAGALASVITRLDPHDHPSLTLDLRRSSVASPVVVHALLRAWEARGRQFGSVRVLMAPGPVTRYLEGLGLDHALDCVRAGETPGELPIMSPEAWRAAQEQTLGHYRALFEAASRQDLDALRSAAVQANPLCVASGAESGGTAFGSWCGHCPMQHQFGGCRPLVQRLVSDAEKGNWEAAQLLAMTLTAELVGMRIPEAD